MLGPACRPTDPPISQSTYVVLHFGQTNLGVEAMSTLLVKNAELLVTMDGDRRRFPGAAPHG